MYCSIDDAWGNTRGDNTPKQNNYNAKQQTYEISKHHISE